MNLIIVESPTKARTLGRFLGSEYHVQSTMGHVRDLPKSKLGIDVEHDFKPEYISVSKKKDVVQGIKQEAEKADKIYLATDPDREGEAIAYHVAELLGKNGKWKIKNGKSLLTRIVFHEITDSAVCRALEKPGEINLQLVDAQQARRVLDRLVGYKLSPLLWRKVRRGLSAGRVQSVTVRLVVDKEREIEAFNSQEYWEIFVEVSKDGKVPKVPKVSKTDSDQALDTRGTRDTFLVKLVKRNSEKIKIGNKDEAEKAVTDLEKASYAVSSIDKREVHKSPPAPFTTSTMTQAAARTYFWSAKKTMSVAQKLYEEGLITYHRTDSTNLSQEAINAARVFVKSKYGENYLPDKPRMYKVKSKVAQEAHEAIRPTDIKIQIPNDKIQMGRDAEILYGLIWKRFAACQMTKAIYNETTINVVAKVAEVEKVARVAKEYLLRASGRVMKFEGWRAVYSKKESEDGVVQLPEAEEGEVLQLIKVNPEQKFTEPPTRYTEATLIKTLEKLGIGRPSTYAPTISTIQNRQYVEKIEGKFKPTPLGTAVNDFLVKYFSDIVDYEFTARMEDSLDEIAKGEEKWVPVVRNFWDPFSKKLEGVQEKAERVKIEPEKTGEKCPKCQEGEQVIRIGKFGRFLSCSRFPDCDWTAPLIEKLAMKCPQCGEAEVIARKTRRGKRFYGCSRYPECKWASWRKPNLMTND